MSWMDALKEAAPAFDEEFGVVARVVPMIARPNRRGEPDARRPPFEIRGVFHESFKIQGPGRALKDGMSEVDVASQLCSFSVERAAVPQKLSAGDLVEIPELGREFRITDLQFEMAFRTRLLLEDVKAPER